MLKTPVLRCSASQDISRRRPARCVVRVRFISRRAARVRCSLAALHCATRSVHRVTWFGIDRVSLTETMRTVVAISLNLVGVLLYAVGLIGPLTPSEGMPNLVDVIVFAVCPVGLLVISLFISRWLAARLIASLEIAGIAGFTGWLLWLQSRTS
jgi:hypothetical protein